MNGVRPSYIRPQVPCHGACPNALGGGRALLGKALFGGGPGGGGSNTPPGAPGTPGNRGGGGGMDIMPFIWGIGGDMGGGGGGTWKGREASLCPLWYMTGECYRVVPAVVRNGAARAAGRELPGPAGDCDEGGRSLRLYVVGSYSRRGM